MRMENLDLFVDLPFGRSPSGVYLLLLGEQVVYVGQSLNVFQRVAIHYQTLERHRKGLRVNMSGSQPQKIIIFDRVKVRWLPKVDLDMAEIALIRQFLPENNTHHTRVEDPHVSAKIMEMPEFQSVIAQAEERERLAATQVKRRKLPSRVKRLEHEFQNYRDKAQPISLPRLKFMENAGNF